MATLSKGSVCINTGRDKNVFGKLIDEIDRINESIRETSNQLDLVADRLFGVEPSAPTRAKDPMPERNGYIGTLETSIIALADAVVSLKHTEKRLTLRT